MTNKVILVRDMIMQQANQSKIFGNIQPNWEEIDKARISVEEFLNKENYSIDDSATIIMIFTELLENAIKYGHYPVDAKVVNYSLRKKNNRITIEVKNPLNESQTANLERLDQQIQWIRGYQSAYEAYTEKLKEISSKQLEEGESGLGLVRIAYEGQSVLDFYVSTDNILAVSAVYER